MAVLFPKTYYTIRRGKGTYIDGVYVPSVEPAPQPILLNIQPASATDLQRMQQTDSGRRINAMLAAFGGLGNELNVAGDDGYAGDIVVYENKRWLVVGKSIFNSIDGGDTAHARYLLALEAEYGPGEVMA